MNVQGVMMDVDVREELAEHMGQFRNATDKGSHLNACSPFREDTKPSFYVYYEDTESARAGFWGDHAADDAEFSRGTFLKLLAYLRDESEYLTYIYLNDKYGTDAPADINRLGLKTNQNMKRWGRQAGDTRTAAAFMDEYIETHMNGVAASLDYLQGRGISPETSAQNRIGHLNGALAIPWKDGAGNLITVKYRSLTSKKFWYIADGGDITNHLYGMDSVYTFSPNQIFIVESEIDVLYLQSLGYVAVALGNKAMNQGRAELLRKAPFNELVIIPDNDEPGQYAAESIVDFMSSYKNVFIVELPEGIKDINDCTPHQVNELIENAGQIKPLESKIKFGG